MVLNDAMEEIEKGIYFSFGYNDDIWADDGYGFIYEWRFRIIDFNDFLNADYDISIRGMLRHKGQKVLKNIKLLFDEGKGEVIFEDFCGYIDRYGRTFIRICKTEDGADFLLDVVINNNSRSRKKSTIHILETNLLLSKIKLSLLILYLKSLK